MNGIWYTIGVFTAAAIAAALLAPVLAYGARQFVRMKGHRAAFALFAVGLCIYAGAKHGPKIVEKPVWMSASATVDTNTWTSATFTISAPGLIPTDAPLYIDAALDGQATTNFQNIVSTTWGERPGVVSTAALSPSNPTNYLWRIRCDYSPLDVRITDFAVTPAITSRFVTCTFTAPTNLVGKVGIVEVQADPEIRVWLPIKSLTIATNNTVNISGNYISNGIIRRFRVRAGDYVLMEGEE